MTAVLSPQPQKAASPSAQQPASSSTQQPASSSTVQPASSSTQQPASSSTRQSQPQPQPQSPTQAEATPTSSTSTSTSSSNTTTKSSGSSSQHLSAPGDANATSSAPSHSSSKPRSRSRGSTGAAPSRSRNSVLSTSTRTSSIFPSFPSSLMYALVRDFAYPAFHPLHYGPQEASHRNSHRSRDSDAMHDDTFSYPYGDRGMGGDRRLSDPPPNWEASKGMWAAGPWGGDGGAVYGSGDQLPATSFGYDGDEASETGERETSGLLSKNHRKSKSMATGDDPAARRRRNEKTNKDKTEPKPRKDNSHLGTGLDSQGFFQAGATDEEDGDDAEHAKAAYGWQVTASPTSELATSQPVAQNHHSQSQYFGESQNSEADQQDEAFAGPSLALYTFQPENANELALKEGQIIQVGYRHGQGWLVAMDLETGEQGLVPEEYVRLLRDIDGWGEDEDMDLGDDGEEEEGVDDVDDDDESGPTIGGEGTTQGGREVKMGDVERALGEPGGRDKEKEIPDRTKDNGRVKDKA